MAEDTSQERRMFWVEVALAVVLGLTALATAWSAYKADLVRDDASSTSTQGIRVLDLGTTFLLHNDALRTRNLALFIEYRQARQGSRKQAAQLERDIMRPELQRQVEWWSRQPRGKYDTPFVREDPYYTPHYLVGGRQARDLSRALFVESDRINRDANKYELLTVILACGLFLLGIAAVLRAFHFRVALLTVGTVFLIAASLVLIWLGVRNVHFDCREFLQNFEHACN
jgi:hypothetical protein